MVTSTHLNGLSPAIFSSLTLVLNVTFGINFPMSEKTDVIGKNAHPFYKWAKNTHGMGAIPKWNFHKIIIGKNGRIKDTFASFTKPDSKKFLSLIDSEVRN